MKCKMDERVLKAIKRLEKRLEHIERHLWPEDFKAGDDLEKLLASFQNKDETEK